MKIKMDIHRFTYSEPFNHLLKNFASIHRHDSRKDFQEEWSKFILVEKTLFEKEASNMILSGYNGDPYVAMYKSVRFYYRKLFINSNNNGTKDKPKRTYITFPHSLIDKVDAFIQQQIAQQLKYIDDYHFTTSISPSDTLEAFYTDYDYDIKNAFEHIINKYKENANQVNIIEINLDQKFKKMYKNRFYKIQEKLKN